MDAGESDLRAESLRDLDRRVIDALVRARAHLGLSSRAEFAKLLDQATGGHGPDVSTYNKWENGSVRPPAWVLVLAADLSTRRLLEESGVDEKPQPEHVARIARLERELAELRADKQRDAQKAYELAEKVEDLTTAIVEWRRRQQDNGDDEQAAGS